ncbi:hypothetical protein [Delftia sp. PS-11]|uniref:hypothetical protein n=1 Tax=Delftia sp. PS-11 TaxID=2767222 RepID=UPI002453C2F7|nr:hypothetical protein [Delftia sp. PS-11]
MNFCSQIFPIHAAQRICALLLAALAGSACAAPASATAQSSLAAFFADALHCRTGFPDGRDEALAQRLRTHGVTVVDRAPGELLDLLYIFATPLDIDGTRVSSIAVRGGSGSIVAARATGSLQALAKRTQARPMARNRWNLEGFGELPAQYTRAMPMRPGLDETPPRLVMGHEAGDTPDALRWGCRSYDD